VALKNLISVIDDFRKKLVVLFYSRPVARSKTLGASPWRFGRLAGNGLENAGTGVEAWKIAK
jgi:hypothetical protein